jgi:ATP-dependent Lhr-like helicase
VGEQFALPAAVEALRALRGRPSGPETVVVSAADPLNLVGILVPGARIAPASREVIAWRDGAVAEVGDLGAVRSLLARGALGA